MNTAAPIDRRTMSRTTWYTRLVGPHSATTPAGTPRSGLHTRGCHALPQVPALTTTHLRFNSEALQGLTKSMMRSARCMSALNVPSPRSSTFALVRSLETRQPHTNRRKYEIPPTFGQRRGGYRHHRKPTHLTRNKHTLSRTAAAGNTTTATTTTTACAAPPTEG